MRCTFGERCVYISCLYLMSSTLIHGLSRSLSILNCDSLSAVFTTCVVVVAFFFFFIRTRPPRSSPLSPPPPLSRPGGGGGGAERAGAGAPPPGPPGPGPPPPPAAARGSTGQPAPCRPRRAAVRGTPGRGRRA